MTAEGGFLIICGRVFYNEKNYENASERSLPAAFERAGSVC